ncbi:MAG: hypothetical protein B6U75_01245 [Desulfurococcales archaeon ex4484_217_1]|nr:MAG: hypothetical protein B6U75_01245 [Desulfurococcales archaeon ex4484_217_1]
MVVMGRETMKACRVAIYVGPKCVTCKEMIEEICGADNRLNLGLTVEVIEKEHEYFKKTRAPMTVFFGIFNGRLRYVGWMCCHMVRVIEKNLIMLAKSVKAKVPKDLVDILRQLNKLDIEMFTSPLCPTGCPDIAEALANIVTACGNVSCTIVGAIEALDLMDELGISKLPTLILNNKLKCSPRGKSVDEAYNSLKEIMIRNLDKIRG